MKPPPELLRRLSDPGARAVLGDWCLERGFTLNQFLGPRIGTIPADAYAYADANANAYAYADANAYANADANAYANADANAYANADANGYANADAYYADADADACAYADADAYADAYADAVRGFSLTGGKHMKAGLYLFAMPSGATQVLRIGWLKHVEGDEYESFNEVTPIRASYTKMFSDAAIDGPTALDWEYTRPIPRPCPRNVFHIQGAVPLNPEQWKKVCPEPKGQKGWS